MHGLCMANYTLVFFCVLLIDTYNFDKKKVLVKPNSHYKLNQN